MADNAVTRFLGGSPVSVLVKLIFVSLIVGAFLVWLDIRPFDIVAGIERFARRLWSLGFESVREVGQYVVVGAMVVIPVWLVMRLLNSRRGR